MSFSTDVRFTELEDVVREAGAFLMSKWPGGSAGKSDLSIVAKSDGSLVSAADMGSNEILMTALRRLFPDDYILSEEVSVDLPALRAAKRSWIIDPLDGTSAFLEGRDDFSILVGLSANQRAEAGLMFFPARNHMYRAVRGFGATMNGARISVSSSTTPRMKCVYARNCSLKNKELESSMMDSGLAFALVARGELDGVVLRMKTHREWDLAAPMAVLAEAGATISDEHGNPIPMGLGEISYQYFVVSNGLAHQMLLDEIDK